MNAGAARPLVFVDVDGLLIPFRPRPSAPRRGLGEVHGGDGSGNPLLERLDPDHGRRLLGLPGDLVWASTWTAGANEVVAPRLGRAGDVRRAAGQGQLGELAFLR